MHNAKNMKSKRSDLLSFIVKVFHAPFTYIINVDSAMKWQSNCSVYNRVCVCRCAERGKTFYVSRGTNCKLISVFIYVCSTSFIACNGQYIDQTSQKI